MALLTRAVSGPGPKAGLRHAGRPAGSPEPTRAGNLGFASPETLVGALLALLTIAAALTLSRGLMRLGADVSAVSTASLSSRWALDRIERELRRAGFGVAPDGDPSCPDEAIELLTEGAIGFRADLDADMRGLSRDPEPLLAGRFPLVPTGNDEVVVYLRRTASGGGAFRAELDADLHSSDRTVRTDGSEVARRDSVVETIDAGPYTGISYTGPGILYRVTFVHDARHYGGGRFRVVQPLADRVVAFRVSALDEGGADVGECGGLDDAASRSCRGQIRTIVLSLSLDEGPPLRREIHLAWRGSSAWRAE